MRVTPKKNKLNTVFPFLSWGKQLNRKILRADIIAGFTGAFIALPQGVSFAMIAGLPAEYGLYTAIIPPIIASLFGSSMHLVSGPATAISIILFSTLSPLAEPGSLNYIQLALTLTFLAGIFQMAFGFAKLGTLINFVSHSVIVGFSAGAAFLIATSQLKHALGISIPAGASFITSWIIVFKSSGQINIIELGIALLTIASVIVLKKFFPKWPGLLIALIIGSLFSYLLNGQAHGVRLLGSLPGQLPPLSSPDFSIDTMRLLAPGALAIALLGLIEALSIARSIATHSNQHINGNQEFIGQGLSNIAGSFFSGYASSGSFTRSGINYDVGAVTPLASIFSAVFIAMIILLIAPITKWLPLSAMGGVILFVAFKLIDFQHIRDIFKSSRGDAIVLLSTFSGTLFFEIEFAIYTGVLLSLAVYLTRTSHPQITIMAPDPADSRRRLVEVEDKKPLECPQINIIRVNGSIFFGAANHISEIIGSLDEVDVKNLLIVGQGINFIDISGAILLVQEARRLRQSNKDLYLCRINRDVYHFLEHSGFITQIGKNHFFLTEYTAISQIFKRLDYNQCLKCKARIFNECQSIE